MSITTNLEAPLTVKIINTGKVAKSFIPYKQNFNVVVEPSASIELQKLNSDEGMYYTKQSTNGLVITAQEATKSSVVVGMYNASDNTFTKGAPFNISAPLVQTIGNVNWETFKVYGTLPYSAETPEIGQPAGNRFMLKLNYEGVTSRDDLPSGDICNIIITDENGNRINSYKKNAFEEDGSLFVIVNAKNNTTLTINLKWVAGDDFTVNYQFTFEDVKLQAVNDTETLANVEDLVITKPVNIKITNESDLSVGYYLYKENAIEYIATGDSITFTSEDASETLYYLSLSGLKVELV